MLLECCVDSVESALEADRGGADRLELCGNLMLGGTTPDINMFYLVKKRVKAKIGVLLRPRFGDFCYTDNEFEILLEDVKQFVRAGADRLVMGVLRPDGTVDEERMEELMTAAGNIPVTFHRAFDVTRDPFEALESCRRLGIDTILTSGQRNTAMEGVDLLAELVEKAGKMTILVGSGVSSRNIQELMDRTGARNFHMSAKKERESPMTFRRGDVSMGLSVMSEFALWRTDGNEVASAKAILTGKGGDIAREYNRRLPLFGKRSDMIRLAVQASSCRPEMEYLYATMPLSDAANYPPKLIETFASHGHFLRENVDWCRDLPEQLYLDYVMYHRVNSEDISRCRIQMYQILWPKVGGKTAEEAIRIINYWCLGEATYRLTDDRTACPATVMRCAYGRCGEESTFTVAALRSVGIPARQVYVPKWPHCDDNHAWVEVWCNGAWHYLGACEPEETLDRGWFSAAASRAMLVHSRSFFHKAYKEEYISREGCVHYWNQLSRYADTTELTVSVMDGEQPVPEVEITAELLNYARFAPVAVQKTDKEGCVHLTTGLGDLHIHARKGNRFLTALIDLRHENTIRLDWTKAQDHPEEYREGIEFQMQPPKDNMKFLLPQSEEMKRTNREKTEAANARRHAKEAAFCTIERAEKELLAADFLPEQARRGAVLAQKARGNVNTILSFLQMSAPEERERNLRLELLESLSEKDLIDCKSVVLEEAFQEGMVWDKKTPEDLLVPYLLCPRIGLEKLTLWRRALPQAFTREELVRFHRNPKTIGQWIQQHIQHHPEEEYDELITTPSAALAVGSASPTSCHILFVALCRSLGIPARLAPDDKRPQFWNKKSHAFVDGMASGKSQSALPFIISAPQDEKWVYNRDWTLGRLEQGQYVQLDLSDLQWTHDGILNLSLRAGDYRLLTSQRMPTGTLLAKEYRFRVSPVTNRFLTIQRRKVILTDLLEDKEIPDFTLYQEDGTPVSMAAELAGKPALVLGLEAGKEPSEHLLNEMLEQKDRFAALPAQIYFVLKTPSHKMDEHIRTALEQLPGVKVLYDESGDTVTALARRLYVDPDKMPLILLTRGGLTGIYASSGYNVGAGDLIGRIFDEIRPERA